MTGRTVSHLTKYRITVCRKQSCQDDHFDIKPGRHSDQTPWLTSGVGMWGP
jgi:hypothetical protein